MTIGYGLLGLVAALIGYFIYGYNALIKKRNLVAEGWSGIDVQLRRRADLVTGYRQQVDGHLAHVDGKLPERLDRVSVEDDAARPR